MDDRLTCSYWYMALSIVLHSYGASGVVILNELCEWNQFNMFCIIKEESHGYGVTKL